MSQSLSQSMRLEQRLTPQLIQSMSILQKPVADLEACVSEALESNAALEVAEPERPADADGSGNGRAEAEDAPGFARLDRFSRDYDMDASERSPYRTRRSASSSDRDPKLAAIANTPGREINLHDHLRAQWSLIDANDELRLAGELLISSLDPDGYLRMSYEEIVAGTNEPVTVESLTSALDEIQRLEPAGVGARDTIECLLLQLDRLPGNNDVERTLIQHHLRDITHNRLPAVARATGYSTGEITAAIEAMRSSLVLHPGYLVGDRSVPAIRPDVVVEYADSGAGLAVRLTRGNTPELCIRDDVLALAKSKNGVKETREFARKQIESATALIDAIVFRKNRLLEVVQSIVEKQREFFDVGPQGLKVFRMSDLAAELSCDPSTISRTVADKYMQTPRGMFPLRYFFTGGTETEDGESMGWDRVKTRVREIVDAEDHKHPLSDDQIAVFLKKEGIEISRRTVAKYRQQLDIPNARQRRQF